MWVGTSFMVVVQGMFDSGVRANALEWRDCSSGTAAEEASLTMQNGRLPPEGV
jgi:hypothetical protein